MKKKAKEIVDVKKAVLGYVTCPDCGADYVKDKPHIMFCVAHTCEHCGTSFSEVVPIVKLRRLCVDCQDELRVKAFTLIELMVVIAIVGLLAAMIVPSFVSMKHRKQQQQAEQPAPLIMKNITGAIGNAVDVYRLEYEGKVYLVSGKGGIIEHVAAAEKK
jgi:prepilin-type N-terminal cleavage/methylation domain-containing protein